MNVTPQELKEMLDLYGGVPKSGIEQKPHGVQIDIAAPDGVKFVGQPTITKQSESANEVVYIVKCGIQTPSTRITA